MCCEFFWPADIQATKGFLGMHFFRLKPMDVAALLFARREAKSFSTMGLTVEREERMTCGSCCFSRVYVGSKPSNGMDTYHVRNVLDLKCVTASPLNCSVRLGSFCASVEVLDRQGRCVFGCQSTAQIHRCVPCRCVQTSDVIGGNHHFSCYVGILFQIRH